MKAKVIITSVAAMAILCHGLLVPRTAGAHCDTMDGPVVMAAKTALEKGEVTPVLKWVKKEYEEEIRLAFKKTLAVRSKAPEAKELAVEKKKHAEESVEAGREFAEAYVEFVHYVERLHLDAQGHAIHHGESNEAGVEGQHKH